jgi:hypothetical protein
VTLLASVRTQLASIQAPGVLLDIFLKKHEILVFQATFKAVAVC